MTAAHALPADRTVSVEQIDEAIRWTLRAAVAAGSRRSLWVEDGACRALWALGIEQRPGRLAADDAFDWRTCQGALIRAAEALSIERWNALRNGRTTGRALTSNLLRAHAIACGRSDAAESRTTETA